MKARDLQSYLASLRGTWSYPEGTVDAFKAGDPDAEVKGIAVGWMSYTWALQQACELGCNLFLCHEPPYFNHQDDDAAVFRMETASRKRRFIEDRGLIVFRCHDLWDQMPRIGIADSWAGLLGFGPAEEQQEWLRIYSIEPTPALEVAKTVAARTREFGQEAVQLLPATQYSWQ